MGFDIVKQDFSKSAQNGYKFDLVLPDGTVTDAQLEVIGDLSPEVQAYQKKKYNEINAKIKQAQLRKKEWEPTLEEAENDSIQGALVRLVGWVGIEEDGKVVEFSKQKAEEILRQHSWIREQIYKESGEVSNFTPKPSKA